ncbi:MAG: hypothetical protein ABJD11_02780 [Gemmatimonadota bacterium]
MTRRITVAFRGTEYLVDLRETQDLNADTALAGRAWHVTRDGAPFTTFPYDRAESEGSVRARTVEWLRTQPMPDDVRRRRIEREMQDPDFGTSARVSSGPHHSP